LTAATANAHRARMSSRTLSILGIAASLLVPVISPAQAPAAPGPASSHSARVPFGVGEALTYDVAFGFIHVGTARMEITEIVAIRGRPAYHAVFTVTGGIPGFRVDDRYDSWMDTATLASLKHIQRISEGSYHRQSTFEMFPERATYTENGGPEQPSVNDPLDDGSFFYFVRTVSLELGTAREFPRYFKPDRNPVVLLATKVERVDVPLGQIDAIAITPTIKAGGVFGKGGSAQVWLSNDARRFMVQMKSKVNVIGSLTLELKAYVPPRG
jgi:Protein of unknown function (DUF3108)